MADTSGQAEIRGIDIDKFLKGFADEDNIMKKFVVTSKTKAREVRWYQKTSGFLDSTDTSGITKSQAETDELSLPVVIEQSFTRNTSYVKKFMFESPTFSVEDIKDTDIDLMGVNIRDIQRGLARQVDQHIIAILTNAAPATPTTPLSASTTVQTSASIDEWDQTGTAKPITDIMVSKRKIRQQGYNPEGSMLGMNSIEHQLLLTHLIETKGSSIPQFASDKVKSGVVMEILGTNIVVSENFTTDWVINWVPSRAVTWKQFMPITSAVMDDPGIGKKIRVWEHGIALLTDPNAVHIISNTGVQ